MPATDCVSETSGLLPIVRARLLEIEQRVGLPRLVFVRRGLGISSSEFHKICCGTANPTLRFLDRIAENIGVPAHILVAPAPLPDDLDLSTVSATARPKRPRGRPHTGKGSDGERRTSAE